MKIVILGAGRIGGSLARNLSNSDYQVSIVDQSKIRLSDLEDKLENKLDKSEFYKVLGIVATFILVIGSLMM